MRKPIIAALAALAVAGGTVAAAVPASAEGWHGGGWRGGGWHGGGWHDHDFDAGPAIFAGVAGLALGAALASDHPRYYDYSPPAYYRYPGPYYGRPYASCYSRERVWDPYEGYYVVRSVPYAC